MEGLTRMDDNREPHLNGSQRRGLLEWITIEGLPSMDHKGGLTDFDQFMEHVDSPISMG